MLKPERGRAFLPVFPTRRGIVTQTANRLIATRLIAGAMLVVVGFSGGVALSHGGVAPRLAAFLPAAGSWTSSACAGVDEGAEERARIALRHATEGDEEAWCLLR